MPKKIAMIGAGSVVFCKTLMSDILATPALADSEFVLMSPTESKLRRMEAFGQRMVRDNGLPGSVRATTDRSEAIRDADFVVVMIQVGGFDAYGVDYEIPLKYGVDQCIGDTLGPGGIFRGQRHIPVLIDIAHDMETLAKPGAIMLQYANPMAANCLALGKATDVSFVGLCHGVQGAQHQIAACVEHWARREGMISEEEKISQKEIDFVFSGINHQTWCVKATWRGIDLIPMMLDLFKGHAKFPETEKVRIDVLKRFGHYSTESNGHLSEYLPWYRKRLDQITNWIDMSTWINGETGGYLRVCTEGRNWFETDFPNWMAQEAPRFTPDKRSEEHGSYIIEGMETGRVYRGHFNVVNKGHIPNLPDGCIIEIPGYVDRNGLNMPVVGALPLACAATCNVSVRVQEMSVKAAVTGDALLLKQAMLHDPLTGAICDPEEVWQMTDEMLIAGEEWLPQYVASGAIASAKAALAQHEADGTRVKTMDGFRGMARLDTKTVEEMAVAKEEARANAQAADKGKMTANA